MSFDAGLVWFRRDLRLSDHAALAAALASCRRVHCVFVYDRAILDELRAAGLHADRRIEFIHAAVGALDEAARAWRRADDHAWPCRGFGRRPRAAAERRCRVRP